MMAAADAITTLRIQRKLVRAGQASRKKRIGSLCAEFGLAQRRFARFAVPGCSVSRSIAKNVLAWDDAVADRAYKRRRSE